MVLVIAVALAATSQVRGAALPEFDFTRPAVSAEWGAEHDIAARAATEEGLSLTIGGRDPYLYGPARDYPADQPLWLRLRLRSDQAGQGQVFFFPATEGATEVRSVRFPVAGGGWEEVRVRLPALGPGWRLRIDPPGTGGLFVLGRLSTEPRVSLAAPAWPKPGVPEAGADAATIESGALKLIQNRREFGGFVVEVGGERMAGGQTAPLIGYFHNGAARWFPVNGPGTAVVVESPPRMAVADAMLGGAVSVMARLTDPEGGRWELEQRFTLNVAGTLQFEARARCDQPREILHLPLITLFPGLGSFGTNKVQALLAGVEYLENEPSSSTADLDPPGSDRQVTDTAKLTFPLMAVATRGRYLALSWNPPADGAVCALFDTPDRMLGSGAQVMGLLFPGSDGMNREENSLVPYGGVTVPADRWVRVAGLLLGGTGDSVVPAVRAYVELQGWPALPEVHGGTVAGLELLARGWLDSQIREGDLYRHATPGFRTMPAADAAVYQDWLAVRLAGTAFESRLQASAQRAVGKVAPAEYNQAQVGHVRRPLPALVYGAVEENLDRAARLAEGGLARFESEGLIRYRPSPGGLDYGRTHWASDANGLTAATLATVLQNAAFAGRQDLIDAALRHLRALVTRYANTVPRGAQTWEIALHTPDILAAAYLVECFVLGYELTGDAALLEQARYWAWTGVPFVYLHPPTPGAVGVYATIPVLGATQWVAPNWIGLPVQWCGLAYAAAIQRLARHEPSGPWLALAEGIVRSGFQQTYPASDRENVGLLPDSFSLRPQTRNPANINPGTLQAPAVPALGLGELYDFRVFRQAGLRVHAPGAITGADESANGVRFTVQSWSARPACVVVNGLRRVPVVRVNDAEVPLTAPHAYRAATGCLVLQVQGTAEVAVDAGAEKAP